MANMSYCRFRNTLEDLRDCYDNIDDVESPEEEKARQRLIELCKRIAAEFEEEE
jgi:hypothetical protein